MLNADLSATSEQFEHPIDDDTKSLNTILSKINKKNYHGDTARAEKLQVLTLASGEWLRKI